MATLRVGMRRVSARGTHTARTVPIIKAHSAVGGSARRPRRTRGEREESIGDGKIDNTQINLNKEAQRALGSTNLMH